MSATIVPTFPKELDTYDWQEAFHYAQSVHIVPGSKEGISGDGFKREDIRYVVVKSEGQNDHSNWLILVGLKDNRYGFLSAGCDYTGWDCQAWGKASVSDNLEHLIRYGLGYDDRARLGCLLAEEREALTSYSRVKEELAKAQETETEVGKFIATLRKAHDIAVEKKNAVLVEGPDKIRIDQWHASYYAGVVVEPDGKAWIMNTE